MVVGGGKVYHSLFSEAEPEFSQFPENSLLTLQSPLPCSYYLSYTCPWQQFP